MRILTFLFLLPSLCFAQRLELPIGTGVISAPSTHWDASFLGSGCTLSNSNLTLTRTSPGNAGDVFNMSMSTGKWYTEIVVNNIVTAVSFGIVNSQTAPDVQTNSYYVGTTAAGWGWLFEPPSFKTSLHNSGGSGIGTSISNGTVLMMAYDGTNGFLYIGQNGTWMNGGVPTSGATGTGAFWGSLSGGTYWFAASIYNGGTASQVTINSTLIYTPPTGYTQR